MPLFKNIKLQIMKKLNKTIALFLIFAFALTINPLQSNAKYKDQSGNLPGTVSDGTIYALAGVAVVGIGALDYVLIKKKKSGKSASSSVNYMNNIQIDSAGKTFITLGSEDENISTTPKTNLFFNKETSLMQKMETASRTIPVDIMVAPLATNNNFAFENTSGIQVGIRVRF